MKRIICLLILPLLLCSCSGSSGSADLALQLRSRILNAESCQFDAFITADYGDKTYTFAMGCQGDAHGNLSFAVQQPASIQGITGQITTDGGKLTFDDKVLAFSLLAGERLSPVSGPWVLLKALRGGYIAACDADRLTLHDSYAEDALMVDVFLGSDQLPIRADIYWEGRRILAMELKSFALL